MKCISKLAAKLREKDGDGPVYGLVTVIVICIAMLILLDVMNTVRIYKLVQQNVDHAVLSVAAANAPSMYGGGREGNSGIYDYTDPSASKMDYGSLVTTTDVVAKLQDMDGLGLVQDGTGYAKLDDDGNLMFRITGLTVTCDNAGLKSDTGSSTVFSTYCRLYVPLYFLKLDIGPQVNVEISSRFIPKF